MDRIIWDYKAFRFVILPFYCSCLSFKTLSKDQKEVNEAKLLAFFQLYYDNDKLHFGKGENLTNTEAGKRAIAEIRNAASSEKKDQPETKTEKTEMAVEEERKQSKSDAVFPREGIFSGEATSSKVPISPGIKVV